MNLPCLLLMSVLFIHSGYLKLNLCFNQIPARGERLLHVDGLEPNKKYIFAVAAFNAQGKLWGVPLEKPLGLY